MTPGSVRTDFDLQEVLSEERAAVNAALESVVAELSETLGGERGAVIRHGVLGGGKRIRPILCVAAFRACGGAQDAPIHRLAVSVELIHAYSLMHDDLPCMDDANLRRGRPAAHRAHGERPTMWAGAGLIPAAALQAWRGGRALGLGPRRVRAIVRRLLRAAGAGGMVGGQALDLLGEDRTLDATDLDALHERKTGALLSAAPALGGQAAETSDARVAALVRYGKRLGLAFQIADDLLDATGTTDELGKEPSDENLAKSTYVSHYGIPEARRRARERAGQAREALREQGIDAPLLHALAEYVVRRRS